MTPACEPSIAWKTTFGHHGAFAAPQRDGGDRRRCRGKPRGKMMFKDKYKAAKENEAISASTFSLELTLPSSIHRSNLTNDFMG